MSRRSLAVLESYEVIGQPVVGPLRLTYVPWIDEAVRPYRATRVPSGTSTGLPPALFAVAPAA